MKQKLQRKLKKSGGFTLIEMLIVVAIIAILVAVSIPMVNTSLTKAKKATDEANERAAKAAAIAEYLLADTTPTTDITYCYDAASGKATPQTGSGCVGGITDYGKGTTGSNGTCNGHVHIKVKTDGTTEITWSGSSSGGGSGTP